MGAASRNSSGKSELGGAARTLFDATGLAIEDVATARYIYEKFNKQQ